MKRFQKIVFLCVLCLSLFPLAAKAGTDVVYNDGPVTLQGYWAPSTCVSAERAPVVLIIHQWMGLTEYEKMRADMFAENCYNAFAIDMYGQNIRPQSQEEAGALAGTYKSDPALARRRALAALEVVRKDASVDGDRIAVVGYCFGGTMALEVARSGADVDGVISFHGGLSTPAPVTQPGIIKAEIQVHHGAEDPHVPPAEVAAFSQEMEAAGVDLTFISYANAVHAFTQKNAGNDPSTGVAYNAEADRKSWDAALKFLAKAFRPKPDPAEPQIIMKEPKPAYKTNE